MDEPTGDLRFTQGQVKVNNKVANSYHYTNQPSPETFTYTYPLPAGPKDGIYVTEGLHPWRVSVSRQTYLSGTTATKPTFLATREAVAGIAPVPGLVIMIVSAKF